MPGPGDGIAAEEAAFSVGCGFLVALAGAWVLFYAFGFASLVGPDVRGRGDFWPVVLGRLFTPGEFLPLVVVGAAAVLAGLWSCASGLRSFVRVARRQRPVGRRVPP